MTANRGLFVRNSGNVGTTPIEGRLVLASLLAENAPGVPRQGLLDQKVANLVTGSATDMSYNVGPCTPVLNRATGEGTYLFTLTGTTNVVTDAAPATGSRYDLVYVKQNDPDKGDATNTAVLGVVKGTAAASPVKPTASLPAGAYVLAEVLVNAGAANAAAAGVTITQVWRYTSLRGVPIPVRNQAERDEITPSYGTEVRRMDSVPVGRIREWWNGSIWKLPAEALGIVAYVELPGNTGTINTIQVVLNIPSFTFRAGRRYRVGTSGGGYSNTTSATYGFTVSSCSTGDAASATSGLTQLKARSFRWDVAGEGREALADATRNNLIYSTDTTLQVKLTAAAVVGTGSLVLTSDATNRVMLYIEDLGEAL